MKQPMEGLADHAHFIGAWLRNPLQTGALWPSGQSPRLVPPAVLDECRVQNSHFKKPSDAST